MKKKTKAKKQKPKVKVVRVAPFKLLTVKGPALVTIHTPEQAFLKRVARSETRKHPSPDPSHPRYNKRVARSSARLKSGIEK